MVDPSTHARARYRQQRGGKYHGVLKGIPTKRINMALLIKLFLFISRVSIFKRAECSSSLLRVDQNFLFRNRSILTSGKLCFLDNADLSNTIGHAISSEQRNSYKSTCSLTSFPLANCCCNCSGLWLVLTQGSGKCSRKRERPGPYSNKNF